MTVDRMDRLINRVSDFLLYGINGDMSDREFIEESIARWKDSPEREMQIKGFLYYDNEHDILQKLRTAIADDGRTIPVKNLPNNLISNNQYGKLVDQKTNYLLGKPITLDGQNQRYIDALNDVFDEKFMRILKRAGRFMYCGGIAWLYPYYDEESKLRFRLFPAYEILPFWKDAEHTELIGAVRLYLVAGWDRNIPVVIEKVEVFDETGIHKYILDGVKLVPDVTEDEIDSSYIQWGGDDGITETANWSKIPLIPLKYNDSETSLLKKVKCLQDGLDKMISGLLDRMEEDPRNEILVITNYDGENLGEFRRNLATYGAVKVRDDGSGKGGVDELKVEVNADVYKLVMDELKKAIIENGMGYDAKDDRLSGTPNQMNIQSMYSDIDIDANGTEAELQAAFDDILWFVDAYLANAGKGDFRNDDVNIIFNRDMLMDESSIIENIRNSEGLLSQRTLIAQHPWIKDVDLEIEQIAKEEAEKGAEDYGQLGNVARTNADEEEEEDESTEVSADDDDEEEEASNRRRRS